MNVRAVVRAGLLGILLGAVVLTSGGCGRRDVELWHIQSYEPTRSAVEESVKRYEASSGKTVEARAVANDKFKTDLKTARTAGRLPDVFHTWGGGALGSLAEAGIVADMTERVPEAVKARLHPSALAFVSHEGRLYALPADFSLVVMWYNKEMFAREGVEVPKTFEELVSACKRLKAKGITPIALGNQHRWPGCFYFSYLAMRIGGMEPIAKAEQGEGAGFADASFVGAGKKLRELVEAGAFGEGFSTLTDTDARGSFFTEKSAMMLMGTWLLAHVQKEAPAGFADKLGCFAFPMVKGGKGSPRAVLGGVNAGYAVSAKASDMDGAVGLAIELVSEKSSRAWAGTGRIPALKREAAEEMLAKETLPAAQILYDADAVQLYYDQLLNPALAEVHKDTTEALFLGTLSPEGAVEKMQSEAEKLRRH